MFSSNGEFATQSNNSLRSIQRVFEYKMIYLSAIFVIIIIATYANYKQKKSDEQYDKYREELEESKG